MPQVADLPLKYQGAANAIQGVLNGLWARVKKVQDDYYDLCITEGRRPIYVQLLWTHKQAFAQGTTKVADNTAAHPGDRIYKVPAGMIGDVMTYDDVQIPTWDDVPGAIPNGCRVAVYDYDGPKGKGWVLHAEVTVDGVSVVAQRVWGPETYREDGVDVLEEVA